MGKNLIIKNADFSQNAIESGPSDLLYSFSDSVNGTTIDTGLQLLTSITEWTMFVNWSNIVCTDLTNWGEWLYTSPGDSKLCICSYNKNTQKYFTVYKKSNYYNIDGVNYIEPAANTGKIGLRRNGNLGQITFDGVIWKNSNIVLPLDADAPLRIKSPKFTGTAEIKIFNSATKDISQLFSY